MNMLRRSNVHVEAEEKVEEPQNSRFQGNHRRTVDRGNLETPETRWATIILMLDIVLATCYGIRE